jgi:hypothetical protein
VTPEESGQAALAQFRQIRVREPEPVPERPASRAGLLTDEQLAEIRRQRDTSPADMLRANSQGWLRHAARDLLRALDGARGPDGPDVRVLLGDVAAAIEERREGWPS